MAILQLLCASNGQDGLGPVTLKERAKPVHSAKNMSKTQGKYGDQITFWGGIDTQYILPNETSGKVANEVHRMVEILGRGGGYVVSAVHNTQPDVPPENIVTMCNAVVGEAK